MIVVYLLACLDHSMWPVLELEICHRSIQLSLGKKVRKGISLAVTRKAIGTLIDSFIFSNDMLMVFHKLKLMF